MERKQIRHQHLDWLRVVSVLLIFIFHSGAPFALGDWHFKSGTSSIGLTVWNHSILLIAIPLLFFISGAGSFLALQQKDPKHYFKGRVQRLLIPLIFGILIIVPPQVYIERITRNQFSENFLAFYPHYFDGWYLSIGGEGNFAWMGLHLWYLLYLFLLTLILLVWLKLKKSSAAQSTGSQTDENIAIKLPFFILPIIAIEILFGATGLGGWNLLTYPFFFFWGYWLYQRPTRVAALRRFSMVSAVIAIFGTLFLLNHLYHTPAFTGWVTDSVGLRALHALTGCSWIIAVIGISQTWLEVKSRWMRLANEVVLPFYILHQTIIVLLAYGLAQYHLVLPLYYTLTLLTSFFSILALILIIHTQYWLRFLFGMRHQKAARPPTN